MTADWFEISERFTWLPPVRRWRERELARIAERKRKWREFQDAGGVSAVLEKRRPQLEAALLADSALYKRLKERAAVKGVEDDG